MIGIEEVVAAYLSAWNESDEHARAALLERCWAKGATYTDPTAHVEGRAALRDHIGGFQQQMPGSKLARTSGVDQHHGCIRFTWALRGPDGTQTMEGIDFGELGADGRLSRIAGFFGLPPAV